MRMRRVRPWGMGPRIAPGELVKDPVCGMTVDPSTAKGGRVEHAGREYAFCSQGCRAKYLADPARYASEAPRLHTHGAYTCPMHPEVRSDQPGSCPKCGMALEPVVPAKPAPTQWTCPMHPEIVRDAPGSCPICGMALEPRTITAEPTADPELHDMKRRFVVATALTAPLLAIAMSEMFASGLLSPRVRAYAELALATPVCVWAAWPFYVRFAQSIANRSLNMFTLIGLGVGVAYIYSVIATVLPSLFPTGFRDDNGQVAVYFEAAGMIVTLILL